MIVFSTAAGKPAISPAIETQNTFYTASLVKVMDSASDDITFSDMFRLVKSDVQQTMLSHPVPAIRQLAQFPFIAENVRARFPLSVSAVSGAPQRFTDADESQSWQELQASAWPADVMKLAKSYLERFPKSTLAGSALVALEGATEADKAMRRNDVRLFKSAFSPKSDNQTLWDDLRKAARGDKDAAARIARMYRQGEGEIPRDDNRYQGWLQFASALGNGIAAYELALHYRSQEQPVLASQFEARARELAYTPPPTLDHSRK
jgi:TPR repeat protein